jgi:hypothetical protein
MRTKLVPQLFKQPSAWVPVAMSLAMLAFILALLAIQGIPAPDPNADEGAPAHLFQLWLVVEVLLITYFAGRWLPQAPKQALTVLVLQVLAVMVACAPVFILHL